MPHILLVDDDEFFRGMLYSTLTKIGYQVTEARNGIEALAHYHHARVVVDVVITDLFMPEKEGLETISELREKAPGLKIIAMSAGGRGGREDAREYLKVAKIMGVDGMLLKPFSIDELKLALL